MAAKRLCSSWFSLSHRGSSIANPLAVMSTSKRRRLPVLNPASAPSRFKTVRPNNPAPTSTRIETITWATTRMLPRCADCRVVVPDWPPLSLRIGATSTREPRRAGAIPKSIPTKVEAANVKPRMCQSIPTSIWSGTYEFADRKETKDLAANSANMIPSAPPAADSIRLSVKSCRTIRTRGAPSALRTAISFCLAEERASIRPATLAQANNRIKPTAIISTYSGFAYAVRSDARPSAAR